MKLWGVFTNFYDGITIDGIIALIVMNSFTKIFSIRVKRLVWLLKNISLLNIALIVAQKWKRRCMNENIRTSRPRY